MHLSPQGHYYKLGQLDAKKSRYPLYAVLLTAGKNQAALQYRKGWGSVTGTDIRAWKDGVKW